MEKEDAEARVKQQEGKILRAAQSRKASMSNLNLQCRQPNGHQGAQYELSIKSANDQICLSASSSQISLGRSRLAEDSEPLSWTRSLKNKAEK